MQEIKVGENKFYVGDDQEKPLAIITFYPSGEYKIVIDHTYVCDALKGQGVGQELVKQVVEYARHNNKKIFPRCSYAKKIMHQDKECHDVLLETF
jgi:predicted GNAT family acetyltransferase